MKENLRKNVVPIAVLLIVALLSLFVLSGIFSSQDFHRSSLAALNDKETTVLGLSAASAVSSTLISALPGDLAAPLAEKLIDLNSNFLLILCVIILEKYLLTISATVTFSILIPISCLLGIIYFLTKREKLKILGAKLTIFGILLFALVPASVQVSALIENTYQSSVENTESITEKIAALQAELEDEAATEDEGGISGVISNITDGISTASSAVLDWTGEQLNYLIESIAVLIVTSCVIPILVMFAFVWLAKIILNIELPLSYGKTRKGLKETLFRKKEEM